MSVTEKIVKAVQIIKMNGGLVKSFINLFRTDDLKDGKLVGIDKYGNKYYENNRYFFGRNRWVIYADRVWLNYDASQIPAEWFGWIHYRTDLTPCQDPSRPNYKWMDLHYPNMSGTSCEYVPYSTTKPKILPWNPSKCLNENGK